MGLVWRLEWRRALTRRRLFFLNVVVPLVLGSLVALGGAPAVHAGVVYAVLFVLHGTFGSAIPLVRDGETGLLLRTSRAGIRPGSLLLERAAAGTCLDALQLAPSLAMVAWAAGPSPRSVFMASFALFGALWVANLVGVLVAAAARSLAEAALLAAVTALLLLHVSGVFRTGAPGSRSATLESVAPFRALHESLLGLQTASTPGGITPLLGWAIVLPVVLAMASGRIVSLFRGADAGR